MKILILGYPRGWHRYECLSTGLKTNGHDVDIVTENFNDIVGPYDRVYTISESLLPIQAKLEKQWGITNVSEKAADILSDKSKMDNWCSNLGFNSIVPHSVIPTDHTHLDIFENKPFIIKPVIGSGAKPGGLNYLSFKNKKEFLLHLESYVKFTRSYSSFFKDNKEGKSDGEFNNRKNYYMAQEQLPDDSTMWGPYGYVNDKQEFKMLMWVKGELGYNQISKYAYETKAQSWMSFDAKDVPKDVRETADNFLKKLITSLNLKNMFFSGPDFYKWGNTIKYIDCNPRLGQGLQQMDDIHRNEIMSKVLNDESVSFNKQFYWVSSKLKPGTIKYVKDISHLSNFLMKTNNHRDRLKPGKTIPKFTHVTADKQLRINFLITGADENDMKRKFNLVNTSLQNCIEYVDNKEYLAAMTEYKKDLNYEPDDSGKRRPKVSEYYHRVMVENKKGEPN